MREFDASLSYAAVGCNRATNCLDIDAEGVVVFAGSNAIHLFRIDSDLSVWRTLACHSLKVTCLRFVACGLNTSFGLISASVDKSVVLWQKGVLPGDFVPVKIFADAHAASVTCVCSVEAATFQNSCFCFASSSDDGFINVYEGDSLEACNLRFRWKLNAVLVTCVALTRFRVCGSPLLAVFTTDCKVSLFTWNSSNGDAPTLLCSFGGHENWVSSCSFARFDGDDALWLATASQDKCVRLWKIVVQATADAQTRSSAVAEFVAEEAPFCVLLESVLFGHDDWVFGARWLPSKPLLVSASADKSVMLWEVDAATQLWANTVHLGELGGSSQGFYNAVLAHDGRTIVASEYGGAIHVWRQNSDGKTWHPTPGVGGHTDEVRDVAWSPQTGCLLSASADHSSRIHAQTHIASLRNCWDEIARPQIHGYGVKACVFLSDVRFVSGSDEKTLRLFDAPRLFVKLWGYVADVPETQLSALIDRCAVLGANVPALGLSNKAIASLSAESLNAASDSKAFESSSFTDNRFFVHCATASNDACKERIFLNDLPLESELSNATLWPETEKLYGHVYELFSLSVAPDASLFASTSLSMKAEYATIVVWDAVTLQAKQTLVGAHTLTVTATAFSDDCLALISVSRDRCVALYRRANHDDTFKLVCRTVAHARIVWDCCWLHRDDCFVTGSRDRSVKLWKAAVAEVACLDAAEFEHSVTAVDCIRVDALRICVLAIGLENGSIHLLGVDDASLKLQRIGCISAHLSHTLAVTSCKWRPIESSSAAGTNAELQLASGSKDCSVRIFTIKF